jgi:hypothetical protein
MPHGHAPPGRYLHNQIIRLTLCVVDQNADYVTAPCHKFESKERFRAKRALFNTT